MWIKCIYLCLDAGNVQNILFPRQRISFSMFHFAMIFPVRFLYLSMLLRILKIIIYIYVPIWLCAFICSRSSFFFLCLSNKNAHTHTVSIESNGIFVRRRSPRYHYTKCWWLVSWILNTEKHFFFSLDMLSLYFRIYLWFYTEFLTMHSTENHWSRIYVNTKIEWTIRKRHEAIISLLFYFISFIFRSLSW